MIALHPQEVERTNQINMLTWLEYIFAQGSLQLASTPGTASRPNPDFHLGILTSYPYVVGDTQYTSALNKAWSHLSSPKAKAYILPNSPTTFFRPRALTPPIWFRTSPWTKTCTRYFPLSLGKQKLAQSLESHTLAIQLPVIFSLPLPTPPGWRLLKLSSAVKVTSHSLPALRDHSRGSARESPPRARY